MAGHADKLLALLNELKLRDEPPAEYDVAEWNLILAQDLPGAESIDTAKLLGILDQWAEQVRQETERLYHRFIETPWNYENSQGYFCVLVLVTVLERDLGVRYNPERVRDPKFQDPYCIDPDFGDSMDLFIHGILDGPGGTCSSMPVIYTSVGRRLGYPIKLVEAPGHLFSRWDDPEGTFNGIADRFNIDASGRGFASHPDEHYRSWPRPWTDAEIEHDFYLHSQSQQAEIAGFLATRGACMEDNNQLIDAFRCFHWAYQLTQDKRYYQEAARLQHITNENYRKLEADFEFREKLRKKRQALIEQKTSKPRGKRFSRSGFGPLDVRDVGHGSGCQCPNCRKDRVGVLAEQKGDFGHGLSCRCLTCRENREMAGTAVSRNGLPKPGFHRPHFP